MYPFHHLQVYLFHAFPVVERDLVNVIFDIDLLSHRREIVDDYFCSDGVHWHHHHADIGRAMVNVPDLSMLTMNLKFRDLFVCWFCLFVVSLLFSFSWLLQKTIKIKCLNKRKTYSRVKEILYIFVRVYKNTCFLCHRDGNIFSKES